MLGLNVWSCYLGFTDYPELYASSCHSCDEVNFKSNQRMTWACLSSYNVNSPENNTIKWYRVLMVINTGTVRNIWNVLLDTLMSCLKDWRNSYEGNFRILMNKENIFHGSSAHLSTVGRTWIQQTVSACLQFANIYDRHLWEPICPVIAITWIRVLVSPCVQLPKKPGFGTYELSWKFVS